MKHVLRLIALMSLMGMALVTSAQDAQTPDALCASADTSEPDTRQYSAAEDVLEAGVDYRAIFCTEAGAIYVDLFQDYAPVTVNSFVFLAQNGYYNNTTFHRVLADFMAQGGDPTGTGAGGPGYQFRDEFVGFLTFDRPGLLAMANAGAGTNGSQFFITTSRPDYLNFRHSIFGEVLEGYDNVLNLRLRDPQQSPDFEGSTLNTVLIVTDPASVETTFVDTVEVFDVDAFNLAFDELFTDLPPELGQTADSGTFTTEQVIESAPEALRSAYAELLNDNGHVYRITRVVGNVACTPQAFFTELRYTVDQFADRESASAVFDSDVLFDLQQARGFGLNTEDATYDPFFVQDVEDCAGDPGSEILMVFQRGRYVATVSAIVQSSILTQLSADLLLTDFIAPQFEQILAEPFASELR